MAPRKGLVPLAIGGLLAAGLTTAIVLSDRSDSARSRGSSEAEADAPRIKPNRKIPPRTVTVPDRPPAPVDVEATKSRVAEIMQRIKVGADATGRESLGVELAQCLRRLGPHVEPATKDELLELLTTIEPQWRGLVGTALGALHGDEETARKLLAIYKEERAPDVHATAAIFDALSLMRTPGIAPDLLAMLDERGPHQTLVVQAIGAIGEPKSVTALIGRLDDSTEPKNAIVAVLGASKDPAVLQAMVDAASKGEPAIPLVQAMGQTRNVCFAPLLRTMADRDPEASSAILRALGCCADREGALYLLALAESDKPSSQVAARALHDVRAPDTVAILAEQWDKTGPRGRAAILEASSRLAHPSARIMAISREALEDPDERVRLVSARILGRRGERDNIAPLVDFLGRDTNSRELHAGLEALLRIELPEAAEKVLASLALLPETERNTYRIRAQRILAKG
jgi:HEAT repeat protein